MKTLLSISILLMLSFATTRIKGQDIESVKKEENKFIYSNSIKLFIGDSIYLEGNVRKESIDGFVLVKAISDSRKTISIKFYYDKFGQDNASMLKVTNPYKKTLSYKAKIKTSKSNGYEETSIMPIYPKIYGVEMWPYQIESIILYDFELR